VQIYNLIAYDDRLRMVPVDRAELATEVARVRDKGDFGSLRAAGVGLLVLGEYGEASDRLHKALDVAATAGQTLHTLVNLGDVHRYTGDLAAAEECYEAALDLGRESVPELVDLALQHLGGSLTEQGRLDQARAALDEALALRVAKGDPQLIASTEAALGALATA
jgi:tetratricopeptide (TPR) repeat protein